MFQNKVQEYFKEYKISSTEKDEYKYKDVRLLNENKDIEMNPEVTPMLELAEKNPKHCYNLVHMLQNARWRYGS